MIDFLCKDEIISRGESDNLTFVPIHPAATHYLIRNRIFRQYRVNPTPLEKMREIPLGSTDCFVDAEGNRHTINYSVRFA